MRCPIHSKEYKMGKLYILIEIHMLDLHAFDYISLHFRKGKHTNDNDVSETYKFMFHILFKPTANNNKNNLLSYK